MEQLSFSIQDWILDNYPFFLSEYQSIHEEITAIGLEIDPFTTTLDILSKLQEIKEQSIQLLDYMRKIARYSLIEETNNHPSFNETTT